MKNTVTIALIALAMSAGLAYADRAETGDPGDPGDKECKSGHCRPARPICFNVYCSYQKDVDEENPGERALSCEAAATFTHSVTDGGREVLGNSSGTGNPVFQVSCNHKSVYNGSGHRYTDRLGTRIQGIPGPFPAVVLPVGSLDELRHYSESTLELPDATLTGYCYVYTGPAFLTESQ